MIVRFAPPRAFVGANRDLSGRIRFFYLPQAIGQADCLG
jgi:hypothetical protein